MILKINPERPEGRKIAIAADIMKGGGVVAYPTDGVYGLGCDIYQQEAVDRICKLRGLDPSKAHLTFICKDISQISEFAHQFDNQTFKIMKRNLPGPYTFILKANNSVPRLFKNRRKNIGVRIPDNQIVMELIEALGRPILSASLKSEDEIVEYYTHPNTIYENLKQQVDAVIDGGVGNNQPSTVIDLTGKEPLVIREGAGSLEL